MKNILWFNEIGVTDIALVGGKGANLGELASADLPVPPGFCITAKAYSTFVEDSGLSEEIGRLLGAGELDDPSQVSLASQQIQTLIRSKPIPAVMAEDILLSYRQLGRMLMLPEGQRISVAIRSSATAEDLPDASFAGQQDTYLNVFGEDDLLEKVRDCWASLWTARAMSYRQKKRYAHEKVYQAVVVQAMIPSDVSGVLFTANPLSADHSEAVLNASWGLGEAIVSGMVTPDTFVVSKRDKSILMREIGEKEITLCSRSGGGMEEIATSQARRKMAALTDAQIKALVELGNRVEGHYGAPQDIEWALLEDRFYILQARPITTLTQVDTVVEAGDEYNRTMFVEIFPDALSPIFLSVIRRLIKEMLDFTLITWGFQLPKERNAVGVFHHQPYYNKAYISEALGVLSEPVRERLVTQLINPFGRHENVMRGEISAAYFGLIARMMHFMVRFPPRLSKIIAKYRREVAETEAQAVNVSKMSDADIVSRINSLLFETAREFLSYDFLMIALIGITYQILGSLLERYIEEDTELMRAKLVSGVTGNVTMETNIRLWDLAQIAKSEVELKALFQEVEDAALVEALGQSRHGRRFLRALAEFLKEYGHREIRLDIIFPTWREDPTPVLGFIRSYLEVEEDQSPYKHQERLVAERQEATEEVLARIEEKITGRILVAPLFRWLLKQTQIHTRERDTMHFELTRLFPPFRRLLLELGRRWTARGDLDTEDGIFYLQVEELYELVEGPKQMQDTVVKRQEAYKASQKRPWPDIVSEEGEFFLARDGQVENTGDCLHGISGSPGLATGVARVIRGPEEFGRLNKGDILVAPLTNPVWTPLFAIASGVVTEVGGILSHGAIVAREFGIPAVMSVRGVTHLVSEGALITVDGNQGMVKLKTEGAP